MNKRVEELLQDYGYVKNNYNETNFNKVIKYTLLSATDAPFAIIYYSEENETEIAQLFEICREPKDEYCTLLWVINNKDSLVYSKNLKTKQYIKLKDMLYYSLTKSSNNSGNKSLNSNFENIFFEAHSFLRDIDGLHPDEALDELCKVIYTKLYDEEQKIGCFEGTYGNGEEYAASIRKLYSDANDYDVRVYSLKIPGYKRSRGVFDAPILLSTNAIDKVASLFSNYDFSKSDVDFKARAFQNVYKPTTRAGMGQYFTPIQVIRFIVKCIAPKPSDLIIDPFAGSAHFLTESLNYVLQNVKNDKAKNEFVFYKLHGIEKSERMVRIAMTDMRLHGDGHSNIRCTDSLLSFDTYADLQSDNFDVVMTNPPFGSNLQKETYAYLGEYDLLNEKSKVPLEVLGLERSIQLLRYGGRIGIVLPESIFVNKSYNYVREWLEKNVQIRGIISLPLCTFSPFGANIKTSILIATKKKVSCDYNIFTGMIENIGYDSKGEELLDSDWEKVADEFLSFIEKEEW